MEKELKDFRDWLLNSETGKKQLDKMIGVMHDINKSFNSVNPNELEAVRQHEGEKKHCRRHQWVIKEGYKGMYCLACGKIYKYRR